MLILMYSLIRLGTPKLNVRDFSFLYLLFIVFLSTPIPAQQQFGKIFQKNINKPLSADTIQNVNTISGKASSQRGDKPSVPVSNRFSGKISVESKAGKKPFTAPTESSIGDITKVTTLAETGNLVKAVHGSQQDAGLFERSDSKPLDLAIPVPSQSRIIMDSLILNDGILYRFHEEDPYTGTVVDLWDNGNNSFEGTYMDGKKDGILTWWYENGQKKQEGTENEWTHWNEDGSVKE